jgi:hypothetical protein
MIGRAILDVVICTAITAGLVALLVVGHIALMGRDP